MLPPAATAKAGSRGAYSVRAGQQRPPAFGRQPVELGRDSARGLLPWTASEGQTPDGDQAGLEEYLRRAAQAGQVRIILWVRCGHLLRQSSSPTLA